MTATASEQLASFYSDWTGDQQRRIGVAVSGGSDSLSLLYLLADWGKADVLAATVDHGLRAEAADEAAYVARLCQTLGVKHTTLRWQGWDKSGNLQDQARRARYRLLTEWAQAQTLDAVALGHTQNDQAETFLMRLARGSGLRGLSAMQARFERHGMSFHRPFLGVKRDDLQTLLKQRGVDWVSDPSNEDPGFDRVKTRQVLSQLEALGLSAEGLAETANRLSDANGALAETAAAWVRDASHVGYQGLDVLFDRDALLALPGELSRRILIAAIRYVSPADYAPRGTALTSLRESLEQGKTTTLAGCQFHCSVDQIRVLREYAAVKSECCPTHQTWDQRWQMVGPHRDGLETRALGDRLADCPDWRDTSLPLASLRASPAIWEGSQLIAAPVAGLANGWTAKPVDNLQSLEALLQLA